MRARTGHQNGTKLVTPGISSKSLAGRYSSGGAIAVLIALRTSRVTTPSMANRHSQIENSPNALQNALVLEIRSKNLCPRVVLTISTIPSILDTPYRSR